MKGTINGISTFFEKQTKYFLEEDFKKELMESAKIQEVEKGTVLINEGTYLKVIPIVLSGSIKVFRAEEDKEMLLYYINPNESCIMSITVTRNNETADFKAVTEEDSTILLMPARLILQWQDTYDSFNRFVNDLYRKRFEELLQAFNSVAFQKMDDRLMVYLKNRMTTLGSNELKVTHQDIAYELGIARETVSRLLKKLEQDEIVKLGRGTISFIKKSLM